MKTLFILELIQTIARLIEITILGLAGGIVAGSHEGRHICYVVGPVLAWR